MENLKYNSKLAKDLSELINKYEVTLGILDLGCSGGPDEIFSELNYSGIVVNYHGYDFNDEEIERLSKKYPSNFNFHSYKIVTEEPSEIDQKWWSSFSAGEASAEAQISEFSKKEIIDNNFWNSDLVNKSKEEINSEVEKRLKELEDIEVVEKEIRENFRLLTSTLITTVKDLRKFYNIIETERNELTKFIII